MQARISCPKCKESLRVAENFSGKNVRCKSCRTVFQVPRIDPSLLEARDEQPVAANTLSQTLASDGAGQLADPNSIAAQTLEIELTPPPGPGLARTIAGIVSLFVVAGLGFMVVRSAVTRGNIVEPASGDRPAVAGLGMSRETVEAATNPAAIPVVLDIKPTPFSADRMTISLPGPADDVRVGGGGRYLILHLPKQYQLAIFDSQEGRIVKTVPIDAARFAAGLDKLFIALPDGSAIQRWSLTNFELETSVPQPARIKALAMGSASAGPLVALVDHQQYGRLVCLDPTTLREGSTPVASSGIVSVAESGDMPADAAINVSANARVITGAGIYVRTGGIYDSLAGLERGTFGNSLPANALPGPDGRYLYSGGQLLTIRGQVIGQNSSEPGHVHRVLPALQGPYYLSLTRGQEAGANLVASIHLDSDGRELARVPASEELTKDLNSLMESQVGPIEKHVFLSPRAKLLAILPGSKDRLSLYRVDLDQLLEASDANYLFVTSQPPAEFRNGSVFTYQVVVRTRKGGIRYKLEAGPPGMSITEDGQLRWPVPLRFDQLEMKVNLMIADSGGQEILHTFTAASSPR
jgi:predicted Zn finger-like uncharacterized protein